MKNINTKADNTIYNSEIPVAKAKRIRQAYRRHKEKWRAAFCEVLGIDKNVLDAVLSQRPSQAVFPEDALLIAFRDKSSALKSVWQRADESLSDFLEALPATFGLTDQQYEEVLVWIQKQRDIRFPRKF
ncbi:hypothetical protein [Fulvitalea axinellae]|uniref:hypothetical protein n=1 Tax=Fulvitalea axinellae TaxID=1182444 RepID=UPI0030CA3359